MQSKTYPECQLFLANVNIKSSREGSNAYCQLKPQGKKNSEAMLRGMDIN